MKITVHSSKSVKPASSSGSGSSTPAGSSKSKLIPLTVFDEANHDEYIPGIFVFHPPAPPVDALEAGLTVMLAEYRHWAGRLVTVDANLGQRAILLNDAGARLVEATADVVLTNVTPLEPTPEVLRLHPRSDDDSAEGELMLLQVTRFSCGSFAVRYNMHHSVVDGYATCTSLLAWGQAVRGAAAFDPAPVHDRASLFVPRDPPLVEFEHRGAEFKPRAEKEKALNIVVDVQTVRFSPEFVARLTSEASAGRRRPYSVAQCVAAHLWRCVTASRGIDAHEVTKLHIAVNGRFRMTDPPLISKAVSDVNGRYFRSFVDFASSGAVEREGLVRTAVASELVARTNSSVLGIPFYDLDFGTGKPFLFVPAAQPVEGAVFLVPEADGSGGGVAYVPLYRRAVDTFASCCYSLLPPVVVDARL
ncbi:LOW QUALITY PROTEIN: hypothetical protein SETIT_8G155300v2 [Setaria italica]|uniref:Uncharacterized protein n=1 Tax=Setaria italica TaxID=4555 RepID=A0A368S849_SETIT|nr:LOW QUALITY PROTEIN: hypothetical protein SETIT_8G155300v2 [Setaria italica]